MSQQLEQASNMYEEIQSAIDEGAIKVDDSGAVSIVDDPGERQQIASASKIRRRRAQIHDIQLDDESMLQGMDIQNH